MQKIVAAIPLRRDMDRAEGLRYWRDVHGPIVAKVPGLRKYVQNHSLVAPENDRQFDGTIRSTSTRWRRSRRRPERRNGRP